MESRTFSLVFIGPPTSGKSTLTIYTEETLHLPVIYGSRLADPQDIPTDGGLVPDNIFNNTLEKYLAEGPPSGHIFDGVPRTAQQARIIMEWSKKNGFPIHVINLEIDDEEVIDRTENRLTCSKCQESYHHSIKPTQIEGRCDTDGASLIRRKDDDPNIIKTRLTLFNQEKETILDTLGSMGAQIHSIDANGTLQQSARQLFEALSPLAFDDPKLAEKYFQLKDFCQTQGLDWMLISGACGYIYRGRRPLKDLDVYVATLGNLHTVASSADSPVEHIASSYAISDYLNYSSGVELVADLSIKYQEDGQSITVPFNFEDINREARAVRFMGENCKVMSPEWLIVMKLCMGRSGEDDFGHNKNDYADAYDVTVSQPVNFHKVMEIARQIGAEKRVEEGLEILKSSAY